MTEAHAAPAPDEDAGRADATVDADVQRRLDELEDRWRRALADLDNYRKRTVREMERLRSSERAAVVSQWLPVVDNLDLALEHAGGDAEALVEGVRAVRDQAAAVLAALGFPRQDDLGRQFDPARHEAVGTEASDSVPPGTVVRVVRPGYGDDERLVRPAAVVVATQEQ
jgi:molecular chaperone GrpE